MRKIVSRIVGLAAVLLLTSPLFADNADKALAAFKAKKDKDVAALVQTMAMDADFAGLDKVREAAPDVFDVKYFPSDFVSGVIFKYVETKASQQKPTPPPAKPVTKNPNKKGTWQYVYWDLQQAYAAWQKSTDPATQAKLKGQIDDLGNQIQVLMQNMPPDQQLQVGMALALIAYTGTGDDTASSTQNAMEALNAKFSKQALDILQYLFHVGIPFPSSLPKTLPLSDWQREVSAFDFYTQITDPSKKNEFETDGEFAARKVEVARLNSVIFTTEIALPIKLTLSAYNTDEQYFPIGVGVGDTRLLEQRNYNDDNRISTSALALADVRFYVPRKNAQFFKDKTFATWAASCTMQPSQPGRYSLKALRVKTTDGPVTDNLWAFRVLPQKTATSNITLEIDNYLAEKALTMTRTDTGATVLQAKGARFSFPVGETGEYSMLTGGEGNHPLWKGELKSDFSSPVSVVLVEGTGSFYMATTEVTQAQYRQITGTNPSNRQGDSLPVEQVSWYDAVKFCNQLSLQDGLTPVYDDKFEADRSANGWRLPTEAEWQFAASGGSSGNNYTYSGSNNIDDVAWYSNNSDGKTHPVATKKANELGLFDLSGNVWEWCSDVVSGSDRAGRGGGWDGNADDVRISARGNDYPGSRDRNLGFRVVRSQSNE